MTKKPEWWEKHHEQNDQLRALSGAKMGDGLKLLEKMKRGAHCDDAYKENPEQNVLMPGHRVALMTVHDSTA